MTHSFQALLPLILASGSPRRRELLGRLGLPFEVVVPDVDETFGSGSPAEEVRRIAERKGRAALADRPHGTLIAADTVVELDGEVLGKPRDEGDARRMLGRLSGSRQEVHTGVVVFSSGSLWRAHTETTTVWMRPLRSAEIEAYVASGEPMGKAGGYAIQENGDAFVERLEGDFDNVVGLPLRWLESSLRELLEQRGSAPEQG